MQQPLVHEVESHTHAPPTQCWPAEHGAPLPHLHAPLVQLSVSVGSHARHAPPEAPHADSEGAVQVVPEQQPLAHVSEQPVQLPATQLSPALQVAQAEPPVPHAVAEVPVWQTFAWQQPLGQLAWLQMQAPATHASPAPHGGLLPHWQLPPLQLSAFVASHAPQLAPPVPHVALDGALHTLPEQHPEGHEAASQTQTPPEQRSPTPHAAPAPQAQLPARHESALAGSHVAQPAPPVPHVASVDARQTLALQQPLAHDVASQTHAPPTQCWPATHAGPVPQVQVPAAHVSVSVESQTPHAPPATPHAPAVGEARQLLPWQHPAQVAAHPAQLPLMHASPGLHA